MFYRAIPEVSHPAAIPRHDPIPHELKSDAVNPRDNPSANRRHKSKRGPKDAVPGRHALSGVPDVADVLRENPS